MRSHNFFYPLAIVYTIILFLFASCTKEEPSKVKSPSELNEYEVMSCSGEPMLEFDNEEAFSNFILSIVDLDDEALEDVPELSSFISERKFIDELEDYTDINLMSATNDGKLGSEDYELIEPILSAIVNPYHEIKIAGIIYEINNDFVFAYIDCSNKSTIEQFKANPSQFITNFGNNEFVEINDSILVFKTDIESYDIVEISNDDERLASRAAETERVNYDRGRRRVKGKMYHSKWGIWTSLGVATVNYRKRLGIWFRTKTNSVNVTWEISIINTGNEVVCGEDVICDGQCPTAVTSWQGNETETNKSTSRALYDWAIGIGVKLTGGNISGASGVKGAPIKILRHGAGNNNSFSNHNVGTSCCGSISTPTIQWKTCP